MPDGWEERKTTNGRVYYVNHVTKSTQWDRPTQSASLSSPSTATAQNDSNQLQNGVHPTDNESASAQSGTGSSSKSPTNLSLTNGSNAPISRRHSSEILLNLGNENCSPSRSNDPSG